MVSRPNIVSLIGSIPATNFTASRGMKPTHTTLHHIVGDAGAAIARFRINGEQASSTFVIGSDGTIYQLLEISAWPYTDGNAASNRRSITVEHAGGHANVPYTAAMYKSAIHLQAWLRQEYGIPEANMQLHKNVSDRATACPGGLDTDMIKRESTKLLNGEEMSKVTIEVLRIVHSEMEGWPLKDTHEGKFDSQFMGSWGGTETNDFVYKKWVQNGKFRATRENWRIFYEKYGPQIDELMSRPTKQVHDQIVQQNIDLAARNKELEAQLALQSDDTKNLNALGVALRWFITRVGISTKQ